jgi:hypothetical protein
MKTQFGQSSNVTRRFFQMSRVTVQKMPFVLTGHFGNFGSCSELFSCHPAASSWESLTNSTFSRIFNARPDLHHLYQLDNQPRQIGSHPLHCAALNNIVCQKKIVPCSRLHGISRPNTGNLQ